jgi:predicted nucleotidyltransferase
VTADDPGGQIAEQLIGLPGVVAVALGGSRATGMDRPGSDLDLYVYTDGEVPLAARAAVARALADPAAPVEIGNTTWGPGDVWTEASSGLDVDLMYWTRAWIEDQLDRVLVRHEAAVGYSTNWLHNVRSSRPLAVNGGWHAALQARADQPYPEPLRRAVVARNHPILRSTRISLAAQVAAALADDDDHAVLHRTAAFLASYFDALFAANRIPHPGNKRLVQWVERTCRQAPRDLAARTARIRAAVAGPDGELLALLDGLVDDLDEIVATVRPAG